MRLRPLPNSVTVLTATIPGREDLLARAMRSVYGQTVRPYAHLVMGQHPVPYNAHQPAVSNAYNTLLRAVETEWVLRLDDDNYLLPRGVEAFLEAGRGHSAVLGPEHGGRVPWGCTMMVSAVILRLVGGWPSDWRNNHLHHPQVEGCLDTCEDQALRQVLEHFSTSFAVAKEPVYVLDDSGHERLTDDVPARTDCEGKPRHPSFVGQ